MGNHENNRNLRPLDPIVLNVLKAREMIDRSSVSPVERFHAKQQIYKLLLGNDQKQAQMLLQRFR